MFRERIKKKGKSKSLGKINNGTGCENQ